MPAKRPARSRSPRATSREASASTPTAPTALGARERILRTADALFYQRGVRSVGIDEIIAVAGVAKASLYRYFESKDALVAEYLRLRDEQWFASFVSAVELRSATPRGRLLAVFDVLEEWFQGDDFRGCAFQNAVVELADRRHPGHAIAVANKQAVRRYLRDVAAEAGIADGGGLGDQIAVLAEGAIVTAMLDDSPAPARVARRAAETLLRSA